MASVLNAASFPAGSTAAFIESLVSQQKTITDTADQTNTNTTDVTALQAAVNTLQSSLESVQNTASTALSTANSAQTTANAANSTANSANSGVSDINANAVFQDDTGTQTVQGPFGATQFNVGGTKVVGARQSGWTASTGSGQAGALNADTGFNVSTDYTASDISAIANALIEARRVIVSLQAALTAHGLIG